MLKKVRRKIKRKIVSSYLIKYQHRKIAGIWGDKFFIFGYNFKIPKYIKNLYDNKIINFDYNDIYFSYHENPKVSIIIPVFNNVCLTVKCIKSIFEKISSVPFEIIILDDCSSDNTFDIIKNIKGIRYFRNRENLGFLKNCNNGFNYSRGEYILFLNNDVEVHDLWLDSLLNTFLQCDRVGLAGSKLVYPDGRLQEAGGIVWRDASAWNWLHKKNPHHPAANYERDVDYVSGASIMIPRKLFAQLGLFDERYQNSYYEDTDLAMAVRQAGFRVVYQPFSAVTHHEGASSGNDLQAGTKQYQVINRKIFLEKWKYILNLHYETGSNPLRASDPTVRGHILIVDEVTPTPDRDSGSIDMYNLIRILIYLGFRVHFIPSSNFAHGHEYTEKLQKMGVECVFYPFYQDIKGFLREKGDLFDIVFAVRVKVAKNILPFIKIYCPSTKVIFYTVDLHFLRALRHAELTGNKRDAIVAEETRISELAAIDNSDLTIVLSETEKLMLTQLGKKNIEVVPLIRDFVEPEKIPFDQRNDVLFIGGYEHQPNVDAVTFLVKEIWPALRSLCSKIGAPPIKLHIYGSKMPSYFHDFACPDIEIHGYIEHLSTAFDRVRLSVAPLRYGAGLKGKLATSFSFGVPAIGSNIAFEGMNLPSLTVLRIPSNEPIKYAERILSLYFAEKEWSELSAEVLNYVQTNYNFEGSKKLIEDIVNKLIKHDT